MDPRVKHVDLLSQIGLSFPGFFEIRLVVLEFLLKDQALLPVGDLFHFEKSIAAFETLETLILWTLLAFLFAFYCPFGHWGSFLLAAFSLSPTRPRIVLK